MQLFNAGGRFVQRAAQAAAATLAAPLAQKGVQWVVTELITGGLAAAIRFMRQQGFYRDFIESQVEAIKNAVPGQAIEPEAGEYLIDLGVGLGGDPANTVFDQN